LIAVELETLAHGGDRRETKLLLGISRAEAAGMMGVSEGYVRDAKYVKLHGSSETIEAVRRGEMTLSAAKAKIKKAAGGGKAKAIADDAANKVTAEQTEPSEPGSSCTEADREAARELLDWLVASCDPDQCAELAELAEKAGPYYGQMCRDLANRLQERAAEANWQEGAKAA
jgi:transcriptional regulator with XRE-family HTH domain